MTQESLSSVPSSWPYAERPKAAELVETVQEELPALGGGWTVRLLPGVSLEGAAAPLQDAFGRGGVARAGSVVLRPYRRGGVLRHLNRTTYVSWQRFHAEYQAHARLFELGFPTVEPLGYAFRRRGLGWQGVYFTRWAESTPWPADWSRSSQILPALATAIRALDAAGCWAPDLNATNVLIGPAGELLLLDWDRARWGPAGGLIPGYRARMLRSLQKLGAPSDAVNGFAGLFPES